MLITPDDIIQYSVIEAVKNRPQELLRQDILEAEAEAEQITGTVLQMKNMSAAGKGKARFAAAGTVLCIEKR